MSRWGPRILALLMLLVFLMVMVHLQHQLEALQRNQSGVTTTSGTR
jgi:hypothetical protein